MSKFFAVMGAMLFALMPLTSSAQEKFQGGFFRGIKLPQIVAERYGENDCLVVAERSGVGDEQIMTISMRDKDGTLAGFDLTETNEGLGILANIHWGEVEKYVYDFDASDKISQLKMLQNIYSRSIITNPGQPTDKLIWEGSVEINVEIDAATQKPIKATAAMVHLTLGIDKKFSCPVTF